MESNVPRGTMNHLALTVSDLKRSEETFYNPVLSYLGYAKVENLPEMTLWYSASARAAINLWQAKSELQQHPHERYAPGFHHFAFQAESREDVEGLYDVLIGRSIEVLDPPQDYPHYAPDYYAVFFADPDGMKFELVHLPRPN